MARLKDNMKRLAAVIMAFAMITAIVGCSNPPEQTEPSVTSVNYSVTIVNKGGTPLNKCSVEVFSDASKSAVVFKGMTNDHGQVTFTAPASDAYVIKVSKVPDGYAVAEQYDLAGESTTIVLSPGVMTEADMNTVKYSLGDAVLDFSVTTPDGTEYVLSELLQDKKAVVLNFWYLNCMPCKMEFPYLQEAYDLLSDDIIVLAMNPYDGDDASVAEFQTENGYTFPMAKCDERWQKMMQLADYPRTFVIDRYGNICLMHRGMVTDTQTFLNMFGYFISDDYEQTFVKSVSELPEYVPENSPENPLEFSGVTSFDVTVQPGQSMYVNVYNVGGMNMTVNSDNVEIQYNGSICKPANGVLSLMVDVAPPFFPASICITNTGNTVETYTVDFSYLPGTSGNPFALEMGKFDTEIQEGNTQGVFYAWTASEAGSLTVYCHSITEGVEYDYSLYNLSTGSLLVMSSDGVIDPDTGIAVLTIPVTKGEEVQLSVYTFMDMNGNYPACSADLEAKFIPA